MKNGREICCDYCGRVAEYVDSAVIYGKSYGMIYLCSPCNAYVGVHKGTDKPLGRLANAELREWKKRAHAAFDPIWQYVGSVGSAMRHTHGWPRRWVLPKKKRTSACSMCPNVSKSFKSCTTKGEPTMSIVNSEIHEEVMLQEEYVSIPVSVFEELIRAETERDILESVLSGEHKYTADVILKAIHTARKKPCRGALCIEIGVAPPADPGHSPEDANTAAENKEDPNETEACE